MRPVQPKNVSKKQKGKRHILPFFIPMEGCPGACVFCDQRVISSQAQSPSQEQIKATIFEYTGKEKPQVAFYGGTFSALPQERQKKYLEVAIAGIAEGKISSIRISTRPDFVDDDELDFLSSYGVKTIELGIQSFFDDVLECSGRHYDAKTAYEACLRVKRHGFRLGVQLMTGLPADTAQKSLQSAKIAVNTGCDMARIYPTVVLKDTLLADLWQQGQYEPQMLTRAVDVCCDMAILFLAAGVELIRMGLNPSKETEAAVLCGPYHAAFGNLVWSELRRRQMEMLLQGQKEGKLYAFPGDMEQVVGQNKSNRQWLSECYSNVVLSCQSVLTAGELAFLPAGAQEMQILSQQDFLQSYAERLS